MAIVDPIVLPADVVLSPVEELPEDVRATFEHAEGDYALTRPRSRTPTSIVDVRTAGLLERFRAPRTIVDAVVGYSKAEGLDPRETLEAAFPVLAQFLNSGVLLPADSDLARPIETSYREGDTLAGFEIVRPVHVLVDTEVYLVRGRDGFFAALKLARTGSAGHLRPALRHEADVLGRLDGRVNPRPLELGEVDGRPFLALSWCEGVDVQQAAAGARGHASGGRGELLCLAAGVIEAYAHLHGQGVLHGDVHPRNVLVAPDGAITLVDFGLAAPIDAPRRGPWRGGIDFFHEPELAAARLDGRPAPPLTPAGEQYSVAALVYLLLTGGHTHSFSLEEQEMFRQLATEPPEDFAAHGADGLEHVEQVVLRALEKRPETRFRGLAEFADAVREAAAADRASAPPERQRPAGREARRLLDEVLGRLSGPLRAEELAAPSASVWSGAAGIAYAVLRTAGARDDARLLGLADLWSGKARESARRESGFWNDELGVTREEFGETSLYHSAVGMHYVEALVASARGDSATAAAAVQAFLASTRLDGSHLDLAFGRAGVLLACASLLETFSAKVPGLEERGTELARDLVAASPGPSLGAAHGLCGLLYALLRWSEVNGEAPAPEVETRLRELADLAIPHGRGLVWPRQVGAPLDEGLAASWCNGTAGYVHLWSLAARLLGDDDYRRLAQRAAWTAFEEQPAGGDLCCGLAGRAYSLLALWRHSGDGAWLTRAQALAESAAESIRAHSLRRDSLFKGEVGVALLAAELERPDDARMPLFEPE